MAKNKIGHFEWRTRDASRLKEFYSSLFKWKFKEVMPGYIMVDTGNEDIAAGIWQLAGDSPVTPGTSNYITVADLAATEEKIKTLGGKLLVSQQEIPGIGRFTLFTDCDGNVMAAWQEATKKERKAADKAADAAKKAKKEEKRAKKQAAKIELKSSKSKSKDKDKGKKKKRDKSPAQPTASA
jgi:predicted enzyme related to lactoylglutathione lyase